MGKGALKFGGKSGYLPKPRPIFKTSIFPSNTKKSPNTGYAEGVEHPRGSSREQKISEFIPVSRRLELTALAPKKVFTTEEISKMPIAQQIKIQNSELRRQFLRDSYIKEAERLEREKLEEEALEVEQVKLNELKLKDHEETEAFKLTIPSIEQYLQGPIMRQRTPEEILLLQEKREANRLNNELNLKTKKATSLLELYNASSSFITTEEQLTKAIIQAFDKPNDQLKNSDNFTTLDEAMTKKLDSLIRSTLLGNTENNGPGLNEVEGALNGENDELLELAHQNAELLRQENELKAQQDIANGENEFSKML